MKKYITAWLVCTIGLLGNAHAELKLPAIFADDMVLQRGIDLPVWGWAGTGEVVRVQFAGQTKSAIADRQGRWQLKLDPLAVLPEAQVLTVSGAAGGERVIRNVLVGDVWICSGQSNMQFPLANALNGQEEAARADLPAIRLFFMPNATALNPQSDCAGEWRVCDPESAARFSAVGFFFGRHLHRELQVPVGLIGTSWGGTVAEAWTSASALHSTLTEFDEPVAQVLSSAEALNKAIGAYQVEMTSFSHTLAELFRIEEDLDAAARRAAAEYDDTAWQRMALPGNWEERGLTNLDGIVWFRRTIELPAAWAGREIVLRPGPIDEVDVTWFNGRQVGARGRSRTREVSFWNVPRDYRVPGDLVRGGTNVVAIRVSDMAGQGGLWGAPAESLVVELADGSDQTVVSLAGDWRYEVEYALPPKPRNPESPNRPTVLFNAMIHPLIPFGVAGAIWYQGESNADRAAQYRTLLPTLIADWRQRWGQGDFPFLVVQLANFRAMKDQPDESAWAELREAQALTAKAMPKVGLAVAIDIGEAEDVHPKNKQEVGRRLGLAAQAIAHGQAVPFSGPVYENMLVADGKVILHFEHIDGGLVAKDGPLIGFAIAGADKRFARAQARIEGSTVVVWSPDVAEPVAVRYAWADNPACNLHNGAGLPAVPFRTDAWPPAVAPAIAHPPTHAPDAVPVWAPSVRDLKYGPHERHTLDFWKADAGAPTPVLVLIHGGGWLHGDKQRAATNEHKRTIPFMLLHGISVASINYRYSTQAPLPGPVHDAARAIQFLRSRAAELGLDKERIAATGGSAGGCTALWLATHDDLADPQADDPVARESSRLCGAWANSAQTTLEPDVIRQSVSSNALRHPMICRAGGFTNNAAMQAGYADVAALYREFSPITHLSADDPPTLLSHASALESEGGIHHARFGLIFKERADQVGAPCALSLRKDPTRFPGAPEPYDFLRHVLQGVPLPETQP